MRDTQYRGYHLRDGSDYYDLDNIENFNTEAIDSDMQGAYDAIDELRENLSEYRGNFQTKEALDAYSGEKHNNDYAIVLSDETHNNECWRYVYVDSSESWMAQYRVNEQPLTPTQLNAINSGVTQQKVSTYDSHVTNKSNPHEVTKSQIDLGNVVNTGDSDTPTQGGTTKFTTGGAYTEFGKKVDIDQGSQNVGKFLGVGNDGKVTLVDGGGGGATPEQLATKLDKTKDIRKLEVVTELPQTIDLYTMYLVVEEEKTWPGLVFVEPEDSNDYYTVSYAVVGNLPDLNIMIRKNRRGDWIPWDGSEIYIDQYETLSLEVWNKSNKLSIDRNNYFKFIINGQYMNNSLARVSGNIMSLLDFGDITPYCFANLFKGNVKLKNDGLKLPATNLGIFCYASMFSGCTSLTTAPELPAANLKVDCYDSMFYGCTSLTTAPELPATTLAEGCYNCMFSGCTSLTTAPELPATTLAESCYRLIFDGCTNLQQIKLHYTGNFITNKYFDNWVSGVNKSGVIYYNGSDTTRSDSAIPQNFAVQTF